MLKKLPEVFKKYWLLFVIFILLLLGGILFFVRWREGQKFKSYTAYAVELPKGIEKKDLGNLTSEQKKLLDEEINKVLAAKIGAEKASDLEKTPVVVVLTQNGQPILPDLEKEASGGRGGPAGLETDQVVSQITPTPQKSGPTSTPTPTTISREGGVSPSPEPCTDTDPTQDIYVKGTCTDSEKTYEDTCTPDLLALDQYYCDKWGTLLCKPQRTNCTYDCREGRCLTPNDPPNPTWTPIPTRTPTPTLTPSPSPTPMVYPCIDSDGGKDLYRYGVVSWRGETWQDSCYSTATGKTVYSCSDYSCRLFERYCENELPVSEIFQCPNGCKDGVCLQAGLSPTPTRILTPTVTPTPFCTDSDGGENYSVKGTVRTQNMTLTDECNYMDGTEGKSTPECSGNTGSCTVKEAFCGSNKEALAKLHPCISCVDGVCEMEFTTPTPTPQVVVANELIFIYEGDVEQKYLEKTGRLLSNDVQRIYGEIKKIYGPPFAAITVKIRPSTGGYWYNATTNEIILHDYNLETLVQRIILPFYDDLAYYVPGNWEWGLWEMTYLRVYYNLSQEGQGLSCPLCELNGSSLAWAVGSFRPSDILDSQTLAAVTLYKIYLEDSQFFVKFHSVLYQQQADQNLKNKITGLAAQVKSSVEGVNFNDWLSYNPVLQVNIIPGKYVMLFVHPNDDKSEMIIWAKAVEVKNIGEGLTSDLSGLNAQISAFTHDNFQIWSNQGTTSDKGIVDFGKMPREGAAWFPGFPQGYSGAMRFEISVPTIGSQPFYYPYKDGKPFIPGVDPHPGIFGVVINRTSGYLRFKAAAMEFDNLFINGMFRTKTGFPEDPFYQTRGSVEISYLEPDRNYPQGESGSVKKIITKDTGDYYTTFRMVGAASSSRGAPQASPSAECAKDWQEYKNDEFGFELKIPTGWTDDSIEERQSDDLAFRRLISTLNPPEQIDPKYKISSFDVLASKKDFKTHEDFGRWFDDNTGNEKKSTVTFKGISTEKYVDETEMVCSSQTEEKPANCSHRFEMYYFKKGDVYYVLRVSIYLTPDLEEKNEKNLQCFLESFGFIGEENKEEKNGELIKCTPELFNTQKGLAEQQEEWWTKPGICDKEKEDPVCGHTRAVYDTGQEEISEQTSKNACEYCKVFDENGFREFRGTKSYSLGYTKGDCK